MDEVIESLFDLQLGDDASDSEDSEYEFLDDDPELRTREESPPTVDDLNDEADAFSEPSQYQQRTAGLHAKLDPETLLPVVLQTLELWKSSGIDLSIFLHAVSWGDNKCRTNPIVRYARTSLMKSIELPVILRNWEMPPRTGSKGKRASAAKEAINEFVVGSIRRRIAHDMKESRLIGW
ncbi:hypothetical protein EYR40_001679 [Pleurotus pulmonarius]|nr:hypothetical protein EYR40_001679 [Pleurotus pulmonarius]